MDFVPVQLKCHSVALPGAVSSDVLCLFAVRFVIIVCHHKTFSTYHAIKLAAPCNGAGFEVCCA